MRNKIKIMLLLSCIYNFASSQTLSETIKYIEERYPKSANIGGIVSIDVDEYGNVETSNNYDSGDVIQTIKFNVKDTKITKVVEDNNQGKSTPYYVYKLVFTCASGKCISYKGDQKNKQPFIDRHKEDFFLITNEKDLDRLLKAFNHLKTLAKKDKFD